MKNFCLLFALLVVFGTIFNPAFAVPVTVVLQDGRDGYAGARDTKLVSKTPTTNYGAAAKLELDGTPDIASLLFWDLTAIPAGSFVKSAFIVVHVTNSSNQTYELYRLLQPWLEEEATWRQYSAGANWQAGGAYGSADRQLGILGVLTAPAEGTVTITLNEAGLAIVQDWVNNPAANHGIVIMDYVNNSNGMDFSARETAIVANRPQLIITYDDNSLPLLSVNDITVTEGNNGFTDAVFTLTLSPATDQRVILDFATADGSATSADNDYAAISGEVSFAPGQTSMELTLTVYGDLAIEPHETFELNLSNARNATIADGQGLATILDDDAPPTLSISDVTVTEGDAGTVNAAFSVTLASASSQTVEVDFATADMSATVADNDYVALSGKLTFAPGETIKPITVAVNGDDLDETNETFAVNLNNPVNAVLEDNQGLAAIIDDDGLPQTLTAVFQDGLDGYDGARDAKIMSALPTANYGAVAELELDGSPDIASLLYWDLTTIPAGSVVQSATINVIISNASTDTYEFYQLKRPWVEDEVTWNQAAAGVNWQLAGARDGADRGGPVLGTLTGLRGLVTIPLTSAGVAVLQGWVDNPGSNYGFIVADYANARDGMDFYASERAAVAQRPKLTVTYSTNQVNGSSMPAVEQTAAITALPETVLLKTGYPNPFNMTTRIEYALPEESHVRLEIYNLVGRKVRTLVDETRHAGYSSAAWNGADDFGATVGSGLYFVHLTTGKQRLVTKITLQK